MTAAEAIDEIWSMFLESRRGDQRISREDSEHNGVVLDAVIELQQRVAATPKWYCDVYLPTNPGIYYMENCDNHSPLPGLMLLEEGKPCEPASPTKYFGPIPGAMQPWPMVPLAEKGPPE